MKKFLLFFAALCAICSALAAQSPYYEGQGGKNMGGIRIQEIVPKGEKLSDEEVRLLSNIQNMLRADFNKYAGMTVAAPQDTSRTRYTLSGEITKNSTGYLLFLSVEEAGVASKTMFGPKLCTSSGYQIFQVIKDASAELIAGIGVTLTQAGKDALRSEKEEWKRTANADATEWGKPDYTYNPAGLDPKLVEDARRLAMTQVQSYKAPPFIFTMPTITTPTITVPEFKAPENKMVTTGNIGENARAKQRILDDETEASKARQEAGNRAIKQMQDAFLAQFRAQSEAVKKQQDDLQKQRVILQDNQKTLLARQRQMIAQARDTENSFETFFAEHPPFEIVYERKVAETGFQDGIKRTMDLQFRITSAGTQAMEVIPPVLMDITNGLATITRGLQDINAEFGKIEALLTQVEEAGNQALARLESDYAAQIAKVEAAERDYAAYLARREKEVNLIGFAQLSRNYAVKPDADYAKRLAGQYAVKPSGYTAASDRTVGESWSRTKWTTDEKRTFAITARLLNDAGKTIGTADVSLTNMIFAAAYTQPESANAVCIFYNVLINDITDGLVVQIQQVNGRNIAAAENSSYIKISPLEADGFTKDGWDINGYDRQGYDIFGYNMSGYDKDGYDKLGYNKQGRDKDGYDNQGYDVYGYNRQGRNSSGQTQKEAQQELNRIASEERKARARQFAQERLDGEILVGGGQAGKDVGFFIVSADFIFRLGGANFNFYFPLSLIAEGTFFAGKDILGGNVGGGLRLAVDPDFFIAPLLDISVTGGVSFIRDDAASPVPYLRAGGSFGFLTGGAYIWFYPDRDPGVGWYFGLKFLLGSSRRVQ